MAEKTTEPDVGEIKIPEIRRDIWASLQTTLGYMVARTAPSNTTPVGEAKHRARGAFIAFSAFLAAHSSEEDDEFLDALSKIGIGAADNPAPGDLAILAQHVTDLLQHRSSLIGSTKDSG